MVLVLIVGLLMNAVALPLAAKRVLFLYRAISHGQPAPDRIKGVTRRMGAAVKRQLVEVFGQKKMLKWSVPGTAHFFVMWAFFILATVYVEAYGSLFKLLLHGGTFEEGEHLSWAIPIVGHWALLGFLQDFIAVMALFGLATFWWIRMRNAPKDLGRKSRFFGSHLGPAYLTLFMIFNVIWTMFLFRGAGAALGTLPYENGAFASIGVGKLLDGLSVETLEILEGVGLLLHIGVMLVFLIFVLNSKHLHIFLAPLNVLFGRDPVALGAAKPMMSEGKALTLEDLEEMDEDTKLGVGAAEDFSWKGVLDMATCTECGRCQDQCPAWNTEKPLSPKLLMMALRDHTLSKTPYLLADEDKREGMLEGNEALAREVERPLVGDTGDDWFYMPDSGAGAIDPDVLWSCVTCGACVQQCPVDIEHVDHIIDMRRYQVLVESNFPSELNGLFKGMENKGNPWNMSPTARMDWAKDLPFEVKVVGEDVEDLDDIDWLFWVGCAGAYEDRAKKTTRAVAELLDMAGVSFAVLGNGETCTGDSARRAGNEFVFQGLATQNIETFKEYKVKKAVTTCAHCFNTLKNEYRQLGIELEVVHHTQLLNRLVREKKLTPIRTDPSRSWKGSPHLKPITYHDPCYLGRHNQVYEAPRELLSVIPDSTFVEMPRNSERSFCCGAGGARMWMEETIGTRINETRTKEAVGTGAEQIAVGCPFCRVMLSDGLTAAQSNGEAREEVEVLDVAQMLLAAVKGETKPAAKKKVAASSEAKAGGGSGGGGTSTATIEREETKAEPEAGDTTQTEETVTDTEDVGPAAKASGGSSLFDVGDSADDASEEPERRRPTRAPAVPCSTSAATPTLTRTPALTPATPRTTSPRRRRPSLRTRPTRSRPPPTKDSAAARCSTSVATTAPTSRPNHRPPTRARPSTAARTTPTPTSNPSRTRPTRTRRRTPPRSRRPKLLPRRRVPPPRLGPRSPRAARCSTSKPPPRKPSKPHPPNRPPRTPARTSTAARTTPTPTSNPTRTRPTRTRRRDKAGVRGAGGRGAPKAEAPASSGTGFTPGTEIPEGGSLFDIEAPAEETVETAPAEPSTSDTGENVDRSQDDADTDVEPEEDQADEDKAQDAASETAEARPTSPRRSRRQRKRRRPRHPPPPAPASPPAPRSPKAARCSTSKPPPRSPSRPHPPSRPPTTPARTSTAARTTPTPTSNPSRTRPTRTRPRTPLTRRRTSPRTVPTSRTRTPTTRR